DEGGRQRGRPVPRGRRRQGNGGLGGRERRGKGGEGKGARPRGQQEAQPWEKLQVMWARVRRSVQPPVQLRVDEHKRRPQKPPSSKPLSKRPRLSNNSKARQRPNINSNSTPLSGLFPRAWMHAGIL